MRRDSLSSERAPRADGTSSVVIAVRWSSYEASSSRTSPAAPPSGQERPAAPAPVPAPAAPAAAARAAPRRAGAAAAAAAAAAGGAVGPDGSAAGGRRVVPLARVFGDDGRARVEEQRPPPRPRPEAIGLGEALLPRELLSRSAAARSRVLEPAHRAPDAAVEPRPVGSCSSTPARQSSANRSADSVSGFSPTRQDEMPLMAGGEELGSLKAQKWPVMDR